MSSSRPPEGESEAARAGERPKGSRMAGRRPPRSGAVGRARGVCNAARPLPGVLSPAPPGGGGTWPVTTPGRIAVRQPECVRRCREPPGGLRQVRGVGRAISRATSRSRGAVAGGDAEGILVATAFLSCAAVQCAWRTAQASAGPEGAAAPRARGPRGSATAACALGCGCRDRPWRSLRCLQQDAAAGGVSAGGLCAAGCGRRIAARLSGLGGARGC